MIDKQINKINLFRHIDDMSKVELKNLVKTYQQLTNELLETLENVVKIVKENHDNRR